MSRLPEFAQGRIGTAHIDAALCIGCTRCIEACPKGDGTHSSNYVLLEVVSKNNEKHKVIVKHPEHCSGCYLCVNVCPTRAIKIHDERPGHDQPLPSGPPRR
ncbi:MAG: ferredoxin family protein [Coriobacteriales bacterium]|nr:ferredoxin family protein [Coriobacteriales bacterium]